MVYPRKSVRFATLILAVMASGAAASIDVFIDPASIDPVLVNDTFTVDILANIPEAEAVIGWGLDLVPDGAELSQVGSPTIGPLWNALIPPDGDGLAALAPFPSSVSGNGILLATVTYLAVAEGDVFLLLSDDNPADLTEGFALDPTGFAEVEYTPGYVNVIPEPATLTLLALGALVGSRRR